jgi:methylthioribose-1-phosphate isomerase
MLINGKNYRTVWMENNTIYTIEQRLLPHEFKIVRIKTAEEAARAIKNMTIRGAPAIGGMAAFAMALSVINFKGDDIEELHNHIHKVAELIISTRPTANDLFHAVKFILKNLKTESIVDESKKATVEAAHEYVENSIEACKKIGEFGNALIKENFSILTHCNAGALAAVDYGTALAPIRAAHYDNKKIHVFVDETRPRFQGMLTAWELAQEKIPHSVIVDNAAGYFMKKGEVDLLITGADRVAANGDAANKIGTYEKAVLAKENSIPFYIAAPLSTIDPNTKSGDGINIEERGKEEVSHIVGWENGTLKEIMMAPKESRIKNPAFDVTPAKYITGIITEKGIVKPADIKTLF